MSILAAVTSVLITGAAHADCDQLFKLLPDDGAERDYFGRTVAISGTTVIVGAALDDDNGTDSGSAYLFDIGDPKNPIQIAKLLPDDGAPEDLFGHPVALNGKIAIIGAVLDDDNGDDSGSVYLFDICDPRNPIQIAKLLPDDGAVGDHFGVSIAISGTIAIIGSWKDDDNGAFSGSAYLFDITDPENPIQIAKLLADDGEERDNFGNSVAISGAVALIGASRVINAGNDSGSAYLFDLVDPQNPIQIAKLLPDVGTGRDAFGISVAISGAIGIVGAPLDDDNGDRAGSAYLFDTATGRRIAKLFPDDGGSEDHFGFPVVSNGTTAIIGTYLDDDNGEDAGSAYVFDTITRRQIAKLLPDDGAAEDQFGIAIASSGASAIVGAWKDEQDGIRSGSVYVFDLGGCESCVRKPAWLCDGDVDGDGQVNPVDSGLVQAAFGSSDDQDLCNYDVDCDGHINPVDSGIVQSLFGTCEEPRGACP